MTREKAIKYLKEMKDECNDTIHKVRYVTQEEALEMAIKALEQEPCEDVVSRAEVLKGYIEIQRADGMEIYSDKAVPTEYINNLPPVTPQPKTGHWIGKDGKEQGYDIGGVKTWYMQIMCSECGFIKTAIEGHIGQYNYCPNCGARMVEPQESEVKE